MNHVLRALRHRNYRLYFTAQIFSLLGTWIQNIAMAWLVYRLSGSALLLGLTGFAAQIPILVFAPFGGLWSDRFDRKRLLLVTQTLAMLQAVALLVLTWSGAVQVWHVIALAGVLGLINAFDNPLRQSLTVSLVDDRKDLPNAIALNSFMFNSARLIGPSIAGLLINAVGEAACFLANAASYVGVLGVLAALRLPPKPPAKAHPHFLHGLAEGWRYASGSPVIGPLLALLTLVSFTLTPYVYLMPLFAGEIFHGDARTLGLLVGAAGCGAVVATLFLAARHSVQGLPTLIAFTASGAGVAIALFSRTTSLWFSLPLMVLVGAGIIGTAASINTMLQTVVEDDKRGRVMSFYTMAFLGMAPLGSLAGGRLAHAIGAPDTFLIGGLCCVAGVALYATRVRRLELALAAAPARRSGPPAGAPGPAAR